jgi:hypothetical protein
MGQVSPPIKCRHYEQCHHDQRTFSACSMVECPHRHHVMSLPTPREQSGPRAGAGTYRMKPTCKD